MKNALTTGLILLCCVGCGDPASPPRPDVETDTTPDTRYACGFCTGDNCCCSGLDLDCSAGYLCGVDGFCDPILRFSWTLSVDGAVAPTDPDGAPWDADGLPDVFVTVRLDDIELCRSEVAHDATRFSVECPHLTLDVGAKLTIAVFDADDGGDTLLYLGGWNGGIPEQAFRGGTVTGIAASTNLVQRISVMLSKVGWP